MRLALVLPLIVLLLSLGLFANNAYVWFIVMLASNLCCCRRSSNHFRGNDTGREFDGDAGVVVIVAPAASAAVATNVFAIFCVCQLLQSYEERRCGKHSK